MHRVLSIALVLYVSLAWSAPAPAAETAGQVTEVQGDKLTIKVDSGATLHEKDRIEIFVEIPGVGDAQVGTATIDGVTGDSASAKVEAATGKVEPGQKVRVLAGPSSASSGKKPTKAPEAFESLFNGADLTGWSLHEGDIQSWGVEGGSLVTSGSPPGWLFTEAEFSDFELRLEYKIAENGDSGIGIRTPKYDAESSAMPLQVQIVDDESSLPEIANSVYKTGALWGMAVPSERVTRPAGEWNAMSIIVYRRQVVVSINGKQVANANLDDWTDWTEFVPGVKQGRGHIALQSYRGRAEFRNILIKRLTSSPKLSPPETVEPTRLERVTVVEKGVYRPKDDQPRGNPFENLELAEDTTTIPAQEDTVFGFKYSIAGEPGDKVIPLKIVIKYPDGGFRDPRTGKMVEKEVSFCLGRINSTQRWLRKLGSFGNVPGVWTFEIWSQGRKVAEQKFTLVQP